MTEFANQDRIFYNTAQQSYVHRQKVNVRPDFITPLRLGQDIPHPRTDQFNSLYGKPLNLHPAPPYWHPVYQQRDVYPIPYLLNETSNKLVDVLGVYYKNKDLPVMATRL